MSTLVPPHIVLGLELAGMRLTPGEFDAAEDADREYRYELINERLIVTPPPSIEERGPNEELGYLLLSYRELHPSGKAMNETIPEHTVITGSNRRRADRVIWVGLDRQPDPVADLPNIVIEWVSESKRDWLRDFVEKRQEYLEIGVNEYWIFDRFRRILTVYRGRPEKPEELIVDENQTYQTPLLPGFEVPLARLLAVADRWQGRT
jgi:Uma2 family endonuclease